MVALADQGSGSYIWHKSKQIHGNDIQEERLRWSRVKVSLKASPSFLLGDIDSYQPPNGSVGDFFWIEIFPRNAFTIITFLSLYKWQVQLSEGAFYFNDTIF